MKKYFVLAFCIPALVSIFNTRTQAQSSDIRNIANGYSIYENGYIDQPYMVVLNDGRWLCAFTTGAGKESAVGQHIVSMVSADQGKSWSVPVPIESSKGPSASWAIPYLTQFGRVYVFYDYNGDKVNTMNGKPISHNSELGWYCYKYTDDNGQTWSDRYRLPMPKAPVDFNNDFKGDVQLFWGIDKPNNVGNDMIFAFTRLGKYVQEVGEGWFYKSSNIQTEKDARKLQWDLLPSGDTGIRNPDYGSVQEEFNAVPLNNGGLYCMNRTSLGFAAHSYSHDGGKSWTMPVAATYTPGGSQLLKNPRACPMVFKCSNGKYLFWFHNNGSTSYKNRNPVWISGGVEKNGLIYWSQPEILLYNDDLSVNGMSYPDMVEQDGKFWMSETQKTKARVHPVNNALLDGMWNQANAKAAIKDGIIFQQSNIRKPQKYALPDLPDLRNGGITIDLWITFKDLNPGQIVFDSRENGKGMSITVTDKRTLNLQISDGTHTQNWDTDPGLLVKDKLHHVAFVVDGSPDIITVAVDGKLCDGGKDREFGWTRFSNQLVDINSGKKVALASVFNGKIKKLSIYNRYLTTSECISNYQSGKR
ncbi:sialidase family protein [Chitinophaga sp. MM2321]|uniref:sialidase family protein n=1 Tax=Chitinophaga sp. MM2321 TaxID=3137178 RepID=UPI0032D56FBF